MLDGAWTYRSYRNDPALVDGNAEAALGLIFGEGVFQFRHEGDTLWRGTLDMGSGYVMDLEAVAEPGNADGDPIFAITGTGVAGTPTEGWRYDYRCSPAYTWPNGVAQVPSLLGTVVRVVPHGSGAAGVTASFIAVQAITS